MQNTEASSLAHFQAGNQNLAQLASTRRAKASSQATIIQRRATLGRCDSGL